MRSHLLSIAALFSLVAFSSAQRTPTINFLAYPHAFITEAWGINNNGQVVGYYQPASNFDHGFLYDIGTGVYSSFRTPGNTTTTLGFGINDSGAIVGAYIQNSSGVYHGFRRAPLGGYHKIVDPSGTSSQEAFGINNLDEIVGFYTAPGPNNMNGYLYQSGTFTDLIYPGSTFTVATKINDSGTVVGWFVDSAGTERGFMWQNGVFTEVAPVTGENLVNVNGINNLGDMVGVYRDSASGLEHGFLIVGGVVQTIDCPGTGEYTTLTDVNDSDTFTGTCGTANASPAGFWGTP